MTLRSNSSAGFTLIEILVTLSIIMIISTIGVTGYQAVARSGRDALRKSDLEQLRSALEIYKSEYGAYPIEAAPCLADLSADYINPYPADPKAVTYNYCYILITPLTYELCTHLENGDGNDY